MGFMYIVFPVYLGIMSDEVSSLPTNAATLEVTGLVHVGSVRDPSHLDLFATIFQFTKT